MLLLLNNASVGNELFEDPIMQTFRANLFSAIADSIPFKHEQKKEIEISADLIKAANDHLYELENEKAAMLQRHATEIEDLRAKVEAQKRENDEARRLMLNNMRALCRSSGSSSEGGSQVKTKVSYQKGNFCATFEMNVNK
jgi:hypothetical protein